MVCVHSQPWNRPLRIGCWPGPSFVDNPFVGNFCDALVSEGCVVMDVPDPRRVSPQEIDVLQIHWPDQIFSGR